MFQWARHWCLMWASQWERSCPGGRCRSWCWRALEMAPRSLPRRAPLTAGVKAAGGDEAEQVGVMAQVAAPGVQGHEQAWESAEVARVGTQVEQARACGIEQQPGHEGAVELPQAEEAVRQGEDDVEVRARQQLGQLCGQPALARRLCASRAAAVAAGVVLDRGEVTLRA